MKNSIKKTQIKNKTIKIFFSFISMMLVFGALCSNAHAFSMELDQTPQNLKDPKIYGEQFTCDSFFDVFFEITLDPPKNQNLPVIQLPSLGDLTPFNPGLIDETPEGGKQVPEPATMLLFGTGIIGLAGVLRKGTGNKFIA